MPFKCIKDEKRSHSASGGEGGGGGVGGETAVRCVSRYTVLEGERTRRLVCNQAQGRFTLFVFPLVEHTHKKKTEKGEKAERTCTKEKTPHSAILLTAPKWQIIDFPHACKHCISIEMACFPASPAGSRG